VSVGSSQRPLWIAVAGSTYCNFLCALGRRDVPYIRQAIVEEPISCCQTLGSQLWALPDFVLRFSKHPIGARERDLPFSDVDVPSLPRAFFTLLGLCQISPRL